MHSNHDNFHFNIHSDVSFMCHEFFGEDEFTPEDFGYSYMLEKGFLDS